jgi:RNA polymerase sigma factor (TIGR02999 family)
MPRDPGETPDITPLLERANAGDRAALDEVARLVEADLERVARRLLARLPPGSRRVITLDPVGLVNETFVKLLQQRKRPVNRGQFFAIATRVMIRVLADYARARRRRKRAGVRIDVSLSALGRKGAAEPPSVNVVMLERELDVLEALSSRTSRVAKLRLFWGLENEEIAGILGVSRATVDREWRFARSWLKTRL